MAEVDCPFCRKLAELETLPAEEVVWQFPHSVALLGPWQYYHGYCVLVARRHATELTGLAAAERRAYLDQMCLLARPFQGRSLPPHITYNLPAPPDPPPH